MTPGAAPGRLKKRPEFDRVYQEGRRYHGRLMTVITLQTPTGGPRLGLAASKKLGGAVVRNRLKRMARAIFRLNLPTRPVDVVIVPKAAMAQAPFERAEAEFRRGVTSHGSEQSPGSRRERGPRPSPGL